MSGLCERWARFAINGDRRARVVVVNIPTAAVQTASVIRALVQGAPANTSGVIARARLAAVISFAAVGGAAVCGAAHGAGTPITYGYPYAPRCPAAGIADAVDRWRMDMCNCTSYVAWALHANGQRTDWFVAGAMDAWNWPHVAELAGLRVGRAPAIGAVAVWPKLARPFGHVAYVTGIERNGGIDVSEYNPPDGLARFVYDSRTDVSAAGAVFIYVPQAAA